MVALIAQILKFPCQTLSLRGQDRIFLPSLSTSKRLFEGNIASCFGFYFHQILPETPNLPDAEQQVGSPLITVLINSQLSVSDTYVVSCKDR